MTLVMEHLTDSVVADLVAGRLSAGDAERAGQHASSCGSCDDRIRRARRPAGDIATQPTLDDDLGMSPTMAGDSSPVASSAKPLGRGSPLGRYMVIDVLGRGGMGVVYTAFDPELDRKVAIKVLRPELTGDDSAARLLREGRAIAKLAHPNVVTVFDVGTHDGNVFVAMELVEGCSLDVWLTEQQRPWRDVLAVFVQAGEGLRAAHAIGMIHRDFKPANVLLGNDGRARVTDFGLARQRADAPRRRSSPTVAAEPALTQEGAIAGTPAYMAPEQFEAAELDERTDQFSFGVSLYEALYGERPFAGTNITEIFANITSNAIKPPPGDRQVPAWVRDAVLRSLRADPAERYPSLAELLHALRRDPSARRTRVLAGSGAALGCAGVAAFMLVARGARPGVDCEHEADQKIHAAWRAARASLPALPQVLAIDKLADTWRATSVEACRKPERDTVKRGLVEECLVSELDMYETLSFQLRDASPGGLALIDQDLATSPAACLQPKVTSYAVPLPADRGRRMLALIARTKYLRAETHGPELSVDAAEALAREAVDLAERSGHDPTTANAYSVLGGTLLDGNDIAGGTAAFQKSVTFAERGSAVQTLALSHTIVAQLLCGQLGRAEECDIEIERAKSYFDAHPDGALDQFEMTYAGYQAARLRPEAGLARLQAFLAHHPDSSTDPYMGIQLANNNALDGRPASALAAVDAGLVRARREGPPSLTGELLSTRCGLLLDLDRVGDAANVEQELVRLEAGNQEVASSRIGCALSLASATGDRARVRALAESPQEGSAERRANGWQISQLLLDERVQDARIALGPIAPLRGTADWAKVDVQLASFDVAVATHDLATARDIVTALVRGFATIPSTSYPWFGVEIRAAALALMTGDLPSATRATEHARALLTARGDDTSVAARSIVGSLEAELCLRAGRTGCTTSLVTSSQDTVESHVARLLSGNDVCREWTWLRRHPSDALVQMLDAKRVGARCR